MRKISKAQNGKAKFPKPKLTLGAKATARQRARVKEMYESSPAKKVTVRTTPERAPTFESSGGPRKLGIDTTGYAAGRRSFPAKSVYDRKSKDTSYGWYSRPGVKRILRAIEKKSGGGTIRKTSKRK